MKILAGLLLLAGGLAQAGVLDNFDRPDAPTLGPNWTNQAGGQEILGNMARSLGGAQNSSLATYNGVTANDAFVDVHDGGSVSYLAIVLGYFDLNNNYFIKVQDQGTSGQFNYAAFYYGNNGGGDFFSLNTPFANGRITAFMTGTLATLQIDSNFDGTADQTYTYDYGTATGGNGIGLGFYGAALADNFGTGTPNATPEPGTGAILLIGAGMIATGLKRRRAR
jgi:hypothetical protein